MTTREKIYLLFGVSLVLILTAYVVMLIRFW